MLIKKILRFQAHFIRVIRFKTPRKSCTCVQDFYFLLVTSNAVFGNAIGKKGEVRSEGAFRRGEKLFSFFDEKGGKKEKFVL